MSAASPENVFQNRILLLGRNLILLFSLTALTFPLSASICQEAHECVRTGSQWVRFAALASSS